MTRSERLILEELAQNKWQGRYCCARCGHESYMHNKQAYSRRCKQCKYEESLIKFTAFEGLRIPLIKAYHIVQRIVNTAYVNAEDKIIPVGKLQHKRKDDRKLISIVDYINRCKANEIPPDVIDERIRRIMDRQRPSLRQLSMEFEVEENTMTKLIRKINARITLDEVLLNDSPYERIIDLVNVHYDKELDFYLQMVMHPLVGKWDLGWQQRGKHHFALTHENKQSWSVYRIDFSRKEDDYFMPPFKRLERIEYASTIWKMLFCSDIDKGKYINQLRRS